MISQEYPWFRDAVSDDTMHEYPNSWLAYQSYLKRHETLMNLWKNIDRYDRKQEEGERRYDYHAGDSIIMRSQLATETGIICSFSCMKRVLNEMAEPM